MSRRRTTPQPNRFENDAISQGLGDAILESDLLEAGKTTRIVPKPIKVTDVQLNPNNERKEARTITHDKIDRWIEESGWDSALYCKFHRDAVDLTEAEKQRFGKMRKILETVVRNSSEHGNDEWIAVDYALNLGQTMPTQQDLEEDIQWYLHTDEGSDTAIKRANKGNHRLITYRFKNWPYISGSQIQSADAKALAERSFVSNNMHAELKPYQQVLFIQQQLTERGKTVDDYSLSELISFGLKNQAEAQRIRNVLRHAPLSDYFLDRAQYYVNDNGRVGFSLAKMAELAPLPDEALRALLGEDAAVEAAKSTNTESESIAVEEADASPSNETAIPKVTKSGKATPTIQLNGAKKDFTLHNRLISSLLRGEGPQAEQALKQRFKEVRGKEVWEDKTDAQLMMKLWEEYVGDHL